LIVSARLSTISLLISPSSSLKSSMPRSLGRRSLEPEDIGPEVDIPLDEPAENVPDE
jgi:hypothetical protein